MVEPRILVKSIRVQDSALRVRTWRLGSGPLFGADQQLLCFIHFKVCVTENRNQQRTQSRRHQTFHKVKFYSRSWLMVHLKTGDKGEEKQDGHAIHTDAHRDTHTHRLNHVADLRNLFFSRGSRICCRRGTTTSALPWWRGATRRSAAATARRSASLQVLKDYYLPPGMFALSFTAQWISRPPPLQPSAFPFCFNWYYDSEAQNLADISQ